MILNNVFFVYGMIAFMVFCFWLSLFVLDSTTPKNDKFSWLVLLIVPLFWLIVLPLAIWELIHKNKANKEIFHSVSE